MAATRTKRTENFSIANKSTVCITIDDSATTTLHGPFYSRTAAPQSYHSPELPKGFRATFDKQSSSLALDRQAKDDISKRNLCSGQSQIKGTRYHVSLRGLGEYFPGVGIYLYRYVGKFFNQIRSLKGFYVIIKVISWKQLVMSFNAWLIHI